MMAKINENVSEVISQMSSTSYKYKSRLLWIMQHLLMTYLLIPTARNNSTLYFLFKVISSRHNVIH